MKNNRIRIFLIIIGFLILFPGISLAATNYFPYDLEIPIGSTTQINALSEYIEVVYRFFISIIGIIATVMIMYGGIKWITAAGNESRITAAKETITSAIIGLVLALCSYLILFTINPDLVELRAVDLTEIEPKSDCSDAELHKIAVGSACAKDCECAKIFEDSSGADVYPTCKYNKCQLSTGGLCGWVKLKGDDGTTIKKESRTSACQSGQYCLHYAGSSSVETSGSDTFLLVNWYCRESTGPNTAGIHDVDSKGDACEFPSLLGIDGKCWSSYTTYLSSTN